MSTIKPDLNVNLGNNVLKFKPAARKSEDTAPKDKLDFSSLPSADFDTNLAKLRNKHKFADGNEPKPADFNEPMTNKDIDQTAWQASLTADLGDDLTRIQYGQDVSHLNGYIPTTSQLQEEFNKLAGDTSVPFEYIYDGCYARAHIMCDTMNADHINNAKMFCMVENAHDKKNRLEADNKYMHASWWYHVAPMVFAQDEVTHTVQPFIMDPSMADHPLKPQEWIHQMWDEQDKIKVDVTRDPQYGPLESDGLNQTFEESMPSAREVCAQYTAEMIPIKEQYNHEHPGQGNSKAA